MTTDRVFVLMMMVLLMMSGCFGATSTTEAEEEQDSTTGTDVTSDNVPNDGSDDDSSSNDPIDSSNGQGSDSTNSGSTTSNSQERIWYSSGGVSIEAWNDGQNIGSNMKRCIEWGPSYNSSTGEYIGEECIDEEYPQSASDWNTTMCTDYGGVIVWGFDTTTVVDTGRPFDSPYRFAPECRIIFKTINTTAGEALLIYQASAFSFRTTCMGISNPVDYYGSGGGFITLTTMSNAYSVSNEYNIVANSALDCTHELYRTIPFTTNLEHDEHLWSIVYAIQDTTVV